MNTFIVIYRPHGALNCETQHIGPFPSHDEAYEYLCKLPAIGINYGGENPGVKYVEELIAPEQPNPTVWDILRRVP